MNFNIHRGMHAHPSKHHALILLGGVSYRAVAKNLFIMIIVLGQLVLRRIGTLKCERPGAEM